MKNGGLEVIKSNNLPEKKKEEGELEPENSIELHEKIIEPFPSGNPNPFLRVEKNGKVLYANSAACFLLEHWGIKEGEELPQSLRHGVRRIISQKTPENLEISTGNTTYALKLYPHSEDEYADIYGFDISYRVRTEDQFRSQHEKLEKLVELRTLEYVEANKKLAQEVTERKKIEKTLQNNVKFLETLLDNIPSPVFQRDLNEIYANCNESFARQIIGLPKKMVIGESFSEFQKRVPKELAEIYYKHDRELLDSGESHYYETRVICADGVIRDFLFHKATYEDSSGEIAGIVGVMLDITSRKEAEKYVRKSEERYRIAAEQTGQLVYDYETESKQIDWAGAIPQLTGYSPEEFRQIGLESWIDHVHPEDRERVWKIHEVCRKNGEKYLEEYRFRRKDGSYFHVEDSGVYLKDDLSRVCRIVGVIKDITERKLASEKLQESEARYRSFMKNFRGIAFQMGPDFTLILIDGNIEETAGYRRKDFISGKVDWYQLVHPADLEKLFENRERLANDSSLIIEHEYRIRHRDGKLRWVREIIQNVSDPAGRKRITQGTVYDISRQKEAEESLTKMEEIRKKEIHHRIKNNLQVISSLLELQAEKFNDIEVLEAFRESQNRVATMAIIHEELYRSKNNETLDFSAYLQKLTADLFHSYTIRKGDVNMQLDIEEIFLGMDTAIPLGIIINELVSNSLKHAFPSGRKGEVCIKLCRTEINSENKSISNIINNIGAKSSVDKNIQYTLVVSDNGLGFPENVDFRNTSSLGLQLVNILVEQLEGAVELENSSGTQFKIWFKEPCQSSEKVSSIKGEIQ
ncbi:sensory transduction histidine kinase [Methanosarcina lacustris Z-7289]|uniref:Sensory transduction histidine kinase n=1 Tax=Methanosarcina lacustris Z-7289 TaxID=1434111 RepID=A0A0E3S5I3_9EURY|nr:sensory transduction histidine kinase [Methanosarcina lacustris Z-7289]